MDMKLSETQIILQRSARDFLAKEIPKALVRKLEVEGKWHVPELWGKMAQLGWMGLVAPARYGGSENSFEDLCVLLGETGRACLPGPFFSNVVGAYTLLSAENKKYREELMPGIVEGKIIVTTALEEVDSGDAPRQSIRAIKQRDNLLVSGSLLFVPDADVADYVIAPVTIENSGRDVSLLILERQAISQITLLKAMMQNHLFAIKLNDVPVNPANIISERESAQSVIESVMQKARIGLCAQMAGAAEQVLEMTVSYAKERVQFGKPIGDFQAVQHHCADILIAVEGIKLLTYEVARKIDNNLPCTGIVFNAKAWVSEAFDGILTLAHQVHGGAGFMKDHDLPLFFKRGKYWKCSYGNPAFNYERGAEALIA